MSTSGTWVLSQLFPPMLVALKQAICYSNRKTETVIPSICNNLLVCLLPLISKPTHFSCPWYPVIISGKKNTSLGLCHWFRLCSYESKGPYAKLWIIFQQYLVSYTQSTAKPWVTFGLDNFQKLQSKIFYGYQNLDLWGMFCTFDASSFMNLRQI